MKLYILVGNAFIELFEKDLPLVLTKYQMFNYGTVVTNKLKDFVDLSGAGLIDLKLNYDKLFNIDDNGTITPASNVTVIDLEARCRNNLSTKELEALTSRDARQAIGIYSFMPQKTR